MSPDYTLNDLAVRASAAKTAHVGYLARLLSAYDLRRDWRREHNVPVFGICGMGRAGKDTAAAYVCQQTGMIYPGSASRIMLPLVAHMAQLDEDTAWQERHDHRHFWINACHALRGADYGLLVRLTLGAGDIVTGIRGGQELETVMRTGVIDLSIWIDNPRVPVDPTVEYWPSDCDVMVSNRGTMAEFYAKLDKLLKLWRSAHFREML